MQRTYANPSGTSSAALSTLENRPGPEDPIPQPETEFVTIFSEQTITVDVLPVTIVYEPPGEKGQQTLTISDRFTTRTTATRVRTSTKSVATGVNFLFGAFSQNEETTAVYSTEDAAWNISVPSRSWPTELPNEFPANGDRIVYYKDAQFFIKSIVGYIAKTPGEPDELVTYEEPVVIEMRPVDVRNWLLFGPTVHQLRNGTESASLLTKEAREKLLALDPFIEIGQELAPREAIPAAGPFSFGELFPFFITANPFPINRVRNDPKRFIEVGNLIGWDRCNGVHLLSLSLGTEHSSSVTETFKHTSTVTKALAVKMTPPQLQQFGASIGFSLSVSDRVEFQYARNTMTSTAHTEVATATLGAGISPCPVGSPVYVSHPYFDSTFGTFLFPTTTMTLVNLVGSVAEANGKYVSGQKIVVRAYEPNGTGIDQAIALTDEKGTYRLQLPAGRYGITAQDDNGNAVSREILVEVPAVLRSRVRAEPIVIYKA